MTPHNAAAVGMFDGVHRGHCDILDTILTHATGSGGRPVVLTFAGHPLSQLRPADAPPLLTTAAEKEALIREHLPTADVRMLDFNEARGIPAEEFLRRLRDDLDVGTMVMGYDNRFGCDGPRDRRSYDELGERLGVRVVHVAPLRIDSTTASSSELRRLISGGLTEKAADMLGRRYSVGGTVAHGRKLGRTIGFPTANLSPDPCKLLPATGVYAATASVDSIGTFPAMVNIGHRPTVDRTSDAPLSIEAHLIGADAEMYDRRMVISFVRRLRDERTFASVDELASQLAADRENAIRTLTKK